MSGKLGNAGLCERIVNIGALLSRIVAAVGGGYAVAALASVAVLALPMSKTQAVITGELASFAIYAGAVVWVFAVRSAWRAWAGLLIVAAPLALVTWAVASGHMASLATGGTA
ncbi:iron uptake protein [Pandoraea oxalativorans]|uniref:Iron uptake protein n=1 Tax=Pandoraea oxalativorans TaxID=573737 RepID=A0A0E3YHG0_9BURK|nr:iron uptake protein [Pandoraea oxalativorans]